MVAAFHIESNPSTPIRKLDLTRDLDPVADLIELCFPLDQDPDGQTYIADMRKAAREMRLMGWLGGFSTQYSTHSSGFVWEEDGRIVGNLSLIPLQKDGRRVFLIANVAVHPDFRRRGVARKLTQTALDHLARRHESQVWLQVRDDNPPAIGLYQSLGFRERASRTTWRIRPCDFNSASLRAEVDLSVRRWARCDWSHHTAWLEAAYPKEVRWNLPVNFRRFSPGIMGKISNFFEGYRFKTWTIFTGGRCQGVITWQKADSFANNLWLAFPPENEANSLPGALCHVLKRLPNMHPLSIDYPKGRFEDQFIALGFDKFRTLIWMQREI